MSIFDSLGFVFIARTIQAFSSVLANVRVNFVSRALIFSRNMRTVG